MIFDKLLPWKLYGRQSSVILYKMCIFRLTSRDVKWKDGYYYVLFALLICMLINVWLAQIIYNINMLAFISEY